VRQANDTGIQRCNHLTLKLRTRDAMPCEDIIFIYKGFATFLVLQFREEITIS